MKISELSEHSCQLGEGPLWDVEEGAIYWVDSLGPALYRHDHASSEVRSWQLPGDSVGSLALRRQGGLILAMDQGIYAFDPETGKVESIAQPLAGNSGLRLNDGKVDPFGHFVTGTMNIDFREMRNCAMYRLNTRGYGRAMLDSLPPMRRSSDLDEIKAFARQLEAEAKAT